MFKYDEEEYESRNFILSVEHGEIPSYCLWQAGSFNNESIDEKLLWWSKFLNSKYILVKMISKYWIDFITKFNLIDS